MCSYNMLAQWNFVEQVNLYGGTQKWFQREVQATSCMWYKLLPVCGDTRLTVVSTLL